MPFKDILNFEVLHSLQNMVLPKISNCIQHATLVVIENPDNLCHLPIAIMFGDLCMNNTASETKVVAMWARH